MGDVLFTGEDKKLAVASRLSEWVSNLTSSTEKAVTYAENNQAKIDAIINDYISFSNMIKVRPTLSEEEKPIQKQLRK